MELMRAWSRPPPEVAQVPAGRGGPDNHDTELAGTRALRRPKRNVADDGKAGLTKPALQRVSGKQADSERQVLDWVAGVEAAVPESV